MIFFGTRGRTTQSQTVNGITCSSCGGISHEATGVQRYFHLYWIPVFPTSKNIFVECTHCKLAQEGKELPEMILNNVEATIFQNKSILPLFTGSILIACLIIWGSIMNDQTQKKENQYLDNPLVADVYVIDMPRIFLDTEADYPYGLVKVVAVTGEGVECIVSNMVYNQPSGPADDISNNKAYTDEYYGQDVVLFSFEELKDMRRTGGITKVERRF
jgi:hypothetical protein